MSSDEEYDDDECEDVDDEEEEEEDDDEDDVEEEEEDGEYTEYEDAAEEQAGQAGYGAERRASSASMLKRHRKLRVLLLTKYESVRRTSERLGWRSFEATDLKRRKVATFNVCWTDSSVTLARIMKLRRMQKVNHFPGMLELVRKAGTARNLNKMLHAVGKEYKFFPQTFMLPADYTELKQEWGPKNHGNKTFIVKPSKGCQGNGIYLTRCIDDIPPNQPYIVQRYLHRPHLLNGFKYDLRLYCLLTSVKPLRVFLFREGLVRVCTQKYAPAEKNMSDTRMHLTNYSINKGSDAFVQPEDETDCADAHKRTVSRHGGWGGWGRVAAAAARAPSLYVPSRAAPYAPPRRACMCPRATPMRPRRARPVRPTCATCALPA